MVRAPRAACSSAWAGVHCRFGGLFIFNFQGPGQVLLVGCVLPLTCVLCVWQAEWSEESGFPCRGLRPHMRPGQRGCLRLLLPPCSLYSLGCWEIPRAKQKMGNQHSRRKELKVSQIPPHRSLSCFPVYSPYCQQNEGPGEASSQVLKERKPNGPGGRQGAGLHVTLSNSHGDP